MVSKDFLQYRKVFTKNLRNRLSIEVKVQEDFGGEPGTLLEKLDNYIRHCDLVIHLIGKSAGFAPQRAAVDRLKALYPDLTEKVPCLRGVLGSGSEYEISYTQWE